MKKLKQLFIYGGLAVSAMLMTACSEEAQAERKEKRTVSSQFEEVSRLEIYTEGKTFVGTVVQDKKTGCMYSFDDNRVHFYGLSPIYDENGQVAGCKGDK